MSKRLYHVWIEAEDVGFINEQAMFLAAREAMLQRNIDKADWIDVKLGNNLVKRYHRCFINSILVFSYEYAYLIF